MRRMALRVQPEHPAILSFENFLVAQCHGSEQGPGSGTSATLPARGVTHHEGEQKRKIDHRRLQQMAGAHF